MLRRVLLFVAIWLGGSGLIVGAVLHPLIPGGWYTIILAVLGIIYPVRVIASGLSGATYPSALTRLFVIRPFWYAMLCMPLLAIAGSAGALVGALAGHAGLVAQWSIAGAALVLAAVALAGYFGSRTLVEKRLDVTLPRLPPSFEGMRIVQISDLHVGPHTPHDHLQRVAAVVRAAQPDLVAITGDQVDDFAHDADRFVEYFGRFDAPHGSVAIAGNHDVFAGWDAVARGLAKGDITVLVNDAIALDRGDDRLWVCGTGDPAGRGWRSGGGSHVAPDIGRTLARVPPHEMVIALAHNPALWPALVERGVDLTLSGHTHYGQLAVPQKNWSLASLFLEFAMGHHQREASLLYINPGTNYWGLPLRIGTPPEVTVLTLRAGDARIAVKDLSTSTH